MARKGLDILLLEEVAGSCAFGFTRFTSRGLRMVLEIALVDGVVLHKDNRVVWWLLQLAQTVLICL